MKTKLWQKLVQVTKNRKIYFFLYKSYWYYLTHRKNSRKNTNTGFYAAQPNVGAGIGHQMANWIAGLWFAKVFKLKFAHIPFSSESWEDFLGFGEGEPTVKALINEYGYKKVKLPLFDETKKSQVDLIKKIINSYQDKKIIFLAEQDQFYKDQIGVMSDIQLKFYNAKTRGNDKLVYKKNTFNIAVHVRRGDIVSWQNQRQNSNFNRWQNNDYFVNVLKSTLQQLNTEKQIKVYLFSQGEEDDFPEFKQFDNIVYCLDMSAIDSFLHMVFSDVLITSKSSFSYKPALLNKGLKIVAPDFWHGYPQTKDWVIASKEGHVLLN
jgi:hypothetical protein